MDEFRSFQNYGFVKNEKNHSRISLSSQNELAMMETAAPVSMRRSRASSPTRPSTTFAILAKIGQGLLSPLEFSGDLPRILNLEKKSNI